MGCNNLGDERLEAALERAMPQASGVVRDALKQAVENVARSTPETLTAEQYRERIAELSRTIVGDVGERAMEKVFAKAGHEMLIRSDKHTVRPGHRLPNDAVTIDRKGALIVHDIKASASGKQNMRTNAHGSRSLPKPHLSKTKDGTKQLSDAYNLVRVEEAITFATEVKPGEGPQALVTRIDLVLMQYQTWEVDASGRAGAPIGPPQSAAVEIAVALSEVLAESGLPWP